MPDTTPADRPADLLRAAAEKLRAAAAAVPSDDWGTRPWHVEECSDTDTMESCPCIVAQGEHKEFDQPQVPLIQYVADAETTEHATWIALVHPGVGLALAVWLERAADASDHHGGKEAGAVATLVHPALAVARQLLGTTTCGECGDTGACNGGPCPLLGITSEDTAADAPEPDAGLRDQIAAAIRAESSRVDDLALADAVLSVLPAPALAVARQLLGTTTAEGGEQGAPVNWEAIARQRERELRAVGEARHAAEDTAKRLGAELKESRAIALSRCRTLDEHDAATPPAAPAAPEEPTR